jgi:lipopolysaccharide transport system ATP-binding protein
MSDIAIIAVQLSKHYRIYAQTIDRLKQFIGGYRRQYFHEFNALSEVSFSLKKGEVLGVIGQNGAGKSTLLQLIAGTLTPSQGRIQVNGRVAALLELGAGFNPEFTGAQNIKMYGMLMGLSEQEVEQRFNEIVAFSGIEAFIHQPVKTYSSGMFVRLAFSIATSVDPDILIIDESLSVGDGAFARKSFDRIMALREKGVTIIFCSHALYQVQVLSNRVLWLEAGNMRALGEPRAIVSEYQSFLDRLSDHEFTPDIASNRPTHAHQGGARLSAVSVSLDGNIQSERVMCISESSNLTVDIQFSSDPSTPCPTIAIVFTDNEGRNISSCVTYYDDIQIERNAAGAGKVNITFDRLPLLQGRYWVNVLLMCEQAILTIDGVYRFIQLAVEQVGHEVGVVMLPRRWHVTNADTTTAISPLPTTAQDALTTDA